MAKKKRSRELYWHFAAGTWQFLQGQGVHEAYSIKVASGQLLAYAHGKAATRPALLSDKSAVTGMPMVRRPQGELFKVACGLLLACAMAWRP